MGVIVLGDLDVSELIYWMLLDDLQIVMLFDWDLFFVEQIVKFIVWIKDGVKYKVYWLF